MICHEVSTFATFTYEDESLPPNGSLDGSHWRALTKGIGHRYFGVGEYGDSSQRPHYHAVVYGLDPLDAERFLSPRWPYGFVNVGYDVSVGVARYLAAYTVKKQNGRDERSREWLNGRSPEFARMSTRPALGLPGLKMLERWLLTPAGERWRTDHMDVPSSIKVGKGIYPMGRTLRTKLRELFDIDPGNPILVETRKQKQLAIDLDPLLSSQRERLRHARYDVLKARQVKRAIL